MREVSGKNRKISKKKLKKKISEKSGILLKGKTFKTNEMKMKEEIQMINGSNTIPWF